MRRAEIAKLKLLDVDLDVGFARVNEGKGMKDRVVPLGETACTLLENYLLGIRPEWVNSEQTEYLFLNRWGYQITPEGIAAIVRKYAKAAHLKKSVTTHTLRHTCATHMLRNGANIRHVQELLGHESLESTQVYTRVTINDLKKAHRQYHPREQRLDKKRK